MSETLTPDYEAALLAAKSLAEFNKILKKITKEAPSFQFSPMPLALGAPLTALQQKIVDLNVAAEEAEEKKAAKKIVPTMDGIILYTDGGTKPNPGHSGWGVHGYVYSEQPAKKGSGNPAIYLTDQGYFLKAKVDEKPPEITPMKYIDGLGSVSHACSNNAAELYAAGHGLQHVYQYGVKRVQLYTDSQYVVQGILYAGGWANNNWYKRDGTVPANLDAWKALHGAVQQLKQANVEVKIDWVKGHNGDHGNSIVDRYATLGRQAAQAGEAYANFTTSAPEGYWNSVERHPLLNQKYAYFVSNPTGNVEGEYFMGEHGKVDKKDEKVRRPPWDLFGKLQADNSFSYVKLNTADEALEVLRKNILRLADRTDALLLAFLQKVYEPATYRTLMSFPECALYRLRYDRMDFFTPRAEILEPEEEAVLDEDGEEITPEKKEKKKGGGHEPIVLEMNPPLIAQRGFDVINLLKGIVLQWQAGNSPHLTSTDLTATFYEADEKGQTKLKSDFGPGFTQVKVQANYDPAPESEQLGQVAQTELRLVLGVDTPERNALKKIEKLHPKVTLLTWREGHSVRFATVIECDDGLGIWAGYHSNTKYLKSASSKSK